uniref:Uncharacterized protein n=1 Tax=Manihot esculenta TaxID=3983 RepID=A0A2C9VLB7_MANES
MRQVINAPTGSNDVELCRILSFQVVVFVRWIELSLKRLAGVFCFV